LPAYSLARCSASLSLSLSLFQRASSELDPLLDIAPLGFEAFRSFFVLPLRGVQLALGFRDKLVALSPFLLALRLYAPLSVPSLLLAHESRSRLARVLNADLGSRPLRIRAVTLLRLGTFIGEVRQVGMLGEWPARSGGPLEHNAWLRHGLGDHVGILRLSREALMEEIAAGAPSLESRLHRGRGDQPREVWKVLSFRAMGP